jgi:hypothetical protein
MEIARSEAPYNEFNNGRTGYTHRRVYRGKLRYKFRLLAFYSSITNVLLTANKFIAIFLLPLHHDSPLPSSAGITLKHNECHECLSQQVNRHIKYYGLYLYTESRQTVTPGAEHDRFANLYFLATC